MGRTLVVITIVLLGLVGLFLALRPGTSSGGPQERAYDVGIEDGAMNPAEISVRQDDQVTLRLSSDAPVEVHLHGYDLEEEVAPDEESELSFEAELTGRFEIEDHEMEAELGALLVEPR